MASRESDVLEGLSPGALPFSGALLGAGGVLVAALVAGGLFSKLPLLLAGALVGRCLGRGLEVLLIYVPEEASHEPT